MALLEHVKNPSALANEVLRLLRKGDHAFLQGNPMWTSHKGHHLFFIGNSGRNYSFNSETIVDGWYHLSSPSHEQFVDYAKSKKVPVEDIEGLYQALFLDTGISRLSPTEIIDSFRIPGLKINAVRIYDVSSQKSEYYKIARVRYSVEDLNTKALILHITKQK